MKSYLKIISIFILVAVSFAACDILNDDFDEELLYGTWNSGTDYYTFNSDGTGGTWDTADDVGEDEAQPFTWTLESADLIVIHLTEMETAQIPKHYTVLILTSTTLKIKDDFSTKSFTKVR